MIVLDASAVVELLINGPGSDKIRDHLAENDESVLVPHLMEIEVLSALRGLAASARIESNRVEALLWQLSMLPAHRLPHTPLLTRVWELRHNFSACDAVYLALAEAAGATLYTMDSKLRKGHRARVLVFE